MIALQIPPFFDSEQVAGRCINPASAIAALATLLRAYSCEQALDNFFEVVPCVAG